VLSDAPPDEANKIPEITPKRAVTQPGDLWHIGKHVLLCGDARNQRSYTSLLGGQSPKWSGQTHVGSTPCLLPPTQDLPCLSDMCYLGR
jgi:hypothetical protein